MRLPLVVLVAPMLLSAQQPDSLRPAAVLPAVETTAPRVERELFEEAPNVGTLTIKASALTSAPRFFGEADVLRAVRMLPGVNARNDYSVGMNVRGGEADQNLVLLDGHPIYNPFHMGGVFGSFVEPMVDRVDFMTGGFPARYGGRLSSVLDVRSRVEPRDGLHGTANISLIATTLSLGTATHGGRHTWNVAARRTYADKVIDMVQDEGMPYHFRDVQLHTTHALPRGWSLATTWYDNLDELTQPSEVDDLLALAWGNQLIGGTLGRTWTTPAPLLGRLPLGDSARFEQRLARSRFHLDMDLVSGSLTLRNNVDDVRLAGSLTSWSDRHIRSMGYEIGRQSYDFRANYPGVLYPADTLESRNSTIGLYVDDLWRPAPRWIVQSGLRLDAIGPVGRAVVQPRLSLKYFVDQDLALTAAYGEFAQWSHTLAREDVPIRALDFWAGTDARTPVSRARHFIAGVEQWLPRNRAVRVEAFVKHYGSLVEQNAHSDPSLPGDEFTPLRGISYGADLMLRQLDGGSWSGWLAYGFSFSKRVDPAGRAFFPGQDRRHEANLVLTRQGSHWSQSVRVNLATGTPYTAIIGEFYAREYSPPTHRFEASSDARLLVGPRNGERLPLASRLDVSFMRNGVGTNIRPFLSVMNVYNARNPFAYVYDHSNAPPKRTGLPQFPVFPTIGVAIAW